MARIVKELEVVEANYIFPNGRYLPHPVLVISSNELFEKEEMFYGVLMTTKNHFPEYTIKIMPDWFNKPPNKTGFFATHMINMFTIKDVLKQSNTFLKPEYFPLIRTKIIQSVFYNG